MGKLSKSFTCDLDVLAWLEEYARKEQKKQSYIVNALLRSSMRKSQTWECPDCKSINDNQQTTCHSCPYVLSFEDVKA